jgi:phasin family protein
MTTPFDPKSILENYRSTFAPVIKAQQEGIKSFDRLGRYQYAVAGDYLEWSLAQAKALLDAQSTTELVSKQLELTNALSDKLRTRAHEFMTLATEAQDGLADVVTDLTNKTVAEAKKRAA